MIKFCCFFFLNNRNSKHHLYQSLHFVHPTTHPKHKFFLSHFQWSKQLVNFHKRFFFNCTPQNPNSSQIFISFTLSREIKQQELEACSRFFFICKNILSCLNFKWLKNSAKFFFIFFILATAKCREELLPRMTYICQKILRLQIFQLGFLIKKTRVFCYRKCSSHLLFFRQIFT